MAFFTKQFQHHDVSNPKKPNVRFLFIFLMLEAISHLFQTNRAFDAVMNRAESSLMFWHITNPQ